jgi:hypothetical protein
MPHARETIRNAAVALLTGLSTTGARVYKDRLQARPLETSELPCILVTTGGETVEGSTVHAPAVIQRELELQVIGVVRALTGLDDTLDDIALGGAEVDDGIPYKEHELRLVEDIRPSKAVEHRLDVLPPDVARLLQCVEHDKALPAMLDHRKKKDRTDVGLA